MLNTLQFKGATCYYREEGKGKNIMLLHGFMEEGTLWNELVKALKRSYRVLVPDLPGFGKSALPADGSALSMDLYADYVIAVAQQAKAKKLVLLGHSMGGYIALQVAEKHPALLTGFGLINSHCFADWPEKKEGRRKSNEHIKKYGTRIFAGEFYNSLFDPSYIKKHKTVLKELTAQALRYTPEAIMQANAAMAARAGKEDVLKNLPVPVLFIQGSNDPVVPAGYALKQAAFPAVADIHIFSNAKHMSLFERKAETIAAIKNYVARLK